MHDILDEFVKLGPCCHRVSVQVQRLIRGEFGPPSSTGHRWLAVAVEVKHSIPYAMMSHREELVETSALTALLDINTVVVVIPHRLEDGFVRALIIVPQESFQMLGSLLCIVWTVPG